MLQLEVSREEASGTMVILRWKAEATLKSKTEEIFMHGVLFPAMVISPQSPVLQFMNFIRLQISAEELRLAVWEKKCFPFRSISSRTLKFH